MMQTTAELVPLFRREFELCKVREGELVALLTEPNTRPDYITASAAAAQLLGADTFEITVRSLGWDSPTPVKGMGASVPALVNPSPMLDAVKAALQRATFIVDLIPETVLHVPIREELLAAGARILTIIEPPDVLERMAPSHDIAAAVHTVRERVLGADRLRVTSKAGTDISYDMTDAPVPFQCGYVDDPGRWDHWPSALVGGYPVDGSSNGVVVLDRGDLLFPFKQYAEAPVTFRVEDGYVRSIEGGTDAELLRDFLASWNEPEVYATSHIGFGMHPRARWSSLAFYEKAEIIGMDGRCFPGAFLFTTGPNRYTGRNVEAHLDMPLRGCTVHLDDELLLDEGVLVEPGAALRT